MRGRLGGSGSIIGRNTFQRPRAEALEMLDTIIKIHQGKAQEPAAARSATLGPM